MKLRSLVKILNCTFITSYERDSETNLDYAKARMFGSGFGRFTSPDPLMASAKRTVPQSWNRYTYVLNNPLNLVDPSGMIWGYYDQGGKRHFRWFDGDKVGKGYKPYTGSRFLDNTNYGTIRLNNDGTFTNIDVPRGGLPKGSLSARDADAIRDVTGGLLCSVTMKALCLQNENSEIAGNVETAADVVQMAFLVKSLLKAGLSLAAIAAVIKKNPDDIAKIAEKVVKNFKNLECRECAEALLKEFNKAGISGTIRELSSDGAPMVRAGQNVGEAISTSGRHFGVQVGETIYDLYHPKGIPINDWKNAYESFRGVGLVPQ